MSAKFPRGGGAGPFLARSLLVKRLRNKYLSHVLISQMNSRLLYLSTVQVVREASSQAKGTRSTSRSGLSTSGLRRYHRS